ncbi:MAG: putative sugar O-methyltransferase [Candidatus Omnitrophica bacterium]|nr:putative sugar O-methyltransferase [Candidatus Omnitrophota bacterium]
MSDPDDVLVMAYQYYLNELVPQFIDISEKSKAVIDDVKSHYDEAIKHLEKNPQVKEFIGYGWDEHTQRSRAVLSNGDHYKIMATYGRRSYRSFRMIESGNFNISKYREIVLKVLSIFSALKLKYNFSSLKYDGFQDFFYPHFYYDGNLFNHSLHDLEMRLFLSDQREAFNIVAEIGAGDGVLCRELMQNNQQMKYVIFDIPEILTRSHLFLKNFFYGKKKVGGFEDYIERGSSLEKTIKDFDILCLPCWVAGDCNVDIDLWVTTHVLGEMPVELSKKYIEIINRTGKSFVSVNDNFERPAGDMTLYPVTQYFHGLSSMTLDYTDFPFSSNFPRMSPYYVRHLFVKK